MRAKNKPGSDFFLYGLTAMLIVMAGCGGTDTAARFKMEKMLNDADKLSEQIRVKGPEMSDQDFKTIIDKYAQIPREISPARDKTEAHNASQEKRQAWSLASLAMTRIGTLYLDRKQNDLAFATFKSVYDSPSTTDQQRNAVVNYMAVARERTGQFSQAAMLYDSLAMGYLPVIIPENPNFDALNAPIKVAEMWLKAGDYNRSSQEMERARAYYNQIKTRCAGTAMEAAAIGKIAATYLHQNRFAEAIEILKTVKNDSTGFTSPGMLTTIGDIYLNSMKDYQNAKEVYHQFIRYYPDDPNVGQAKLGLALSLFEQGKYAGAREAVKDIEKLPKVAPQVISQAFYLVALCYDREDKWELAKGQFNVIETAFSGSDESFESVLYVANRYRSKGPDNLAQNAFDEAVNFISKYAELNANNPVAKSRALGYLVRAYSENGDIEAAARHLVELHEQFPQLPEGKFAPLRLGDIYENVLHDATKAVYWLELFVKENPDAENINDLKAHIAQLKP